MTVPRRYHPMQDQPNSAMEGKFLMLSTAATLIIARAKMPSTFVGAGPAFGGDVSFPLTRIPP
ncbi:MAG: hypothetical protein A4E41_01451 [Methanoregulaceae archaeon PtaU1.Bin066]|nr:MAG: hypothetical protein A4E41_01451 [Methanoregulaceae archaeon PtaU1.Bin066]